MNFYAIAATSEALSAMTDTNLPQLPMPARYKEAETTAVGADFTAKDLGFPKVTWEFQEPSYNPLLKVFTDLLAGQPYVYCYISTSTNVPQADGTWTMKNMYVILYRPKEVTRAPYYMTKGLTVEFRVIDADIDS